MNALDLEIANTLLQQNIDWKYLITISKLHKVAPLVFVNLIQNFSTAIPEDILQQCRSSIGAVTIRNLHLFRELICLTDLFKSNDILAIPYKGPVLASKVYQDVSFRQFVDLDFIVDRGQYVKAQELLIDSGYQPPPQREVEWERSFFNEEKNVGVDLHQSLTPDYFPLNLNFSELFARQQPVKINDTEIDSFSSEDLLIVLCIQLAKDSQWTAEVLIKVCDIAELVKTSTDIDWNIIWQACKKSGTKRILLFSLSVANQILDVELPDFIYEKIQADTIVRQAAKLVSEDFFDRTEESFKNRTFKERIYLRKLLRERWQDKVVYYFKTAVTPNIYDREIVALPSYLDFLYYFLRPIRATIKYFNRSS